METSQEKKSGSEINTENKKTLYDTPRIETDNLLMAEKILAVFFVIILFGSIGSAFYRYLIKRDFVVQSQVECDPETEKCFVWECDPASEEEDQKCSEDEEENIWYYKIIRKNAQNVPICKKNGEGCEELSCQIGEVGCSEEFCTSENVPEGERCNDPDQYILENPLEEETDECLPDDEDCDIEEEPSEENIQICDPEIENCEDFDENDIGNESDIPENSENNSPSESPASL